MFDFEKIVENQKVVINSRSPKDNAPKVDPLGSQYQKGKCKTAQINLCIAVASEIMQQQDVSFVPVEAVMSVALCLGFDLSNKNTTAYKRIVSHCTHKDIASCEYKACKFTVIEALTEKVKVKGTRKHQERLTFTRSSREITALELTDKGEQVQFDVLCDFPADIEGLEKASFDSLY